MAGFLYLSTSVAYAREYIDVAVAETTHRKHHSVWMECCAGDWAALRGS